MNSEPLSVRILSMDQDHHFQDPGQIVSTDPPSHLKPQGLLAEIVDQSQDLQGLVVFGAIEHEVHRPTDSGLGGQIQGNPLTDDLLAQSTAQPKVLFPVQAVELLVVHSPTRVPMEAVQHPIPQLLMAMSQAADLLSTTLAATRAGRTVETRARQEVDTG